MLVATGQPLPRSLWGRELVERVTSGEVGTSLVKESAAQHSTGDSDKRASGSGWSCDVSPLGSGL